VDDKAITSKRIPVSSADVLPTAAPENHYISKRGGLPPMGHRIKIKQEPICIKYTLKSAWLLFTK